MAKEKRKFKKERPPDPNSTEVDWRLFIAVPLPAEAVALVDEIVGTFADGDWPIRWVAPETAHLTLHFLGDVSQERAELLRLALGQAISRQPAFALQTADLGVFPNPRQPRVLWIGLTGQTQRLAMLHAAIAETLRALELPVEARELQPHITLGRVRDNPSSGFPVALQRKLNDPTVRSLAARSSVRFPVDEVLLIRSFLGRGGARHEPIGRYPLSQRDAGTT